VGDTILDLYDVTALLGEGGMGKVYKVHHRGWAVDLAVKSPRPEIFAHAGGQENFVREAETWVNLGLHPHIVSCHYVRSLGGIPRVFAEYVSGGSLADWIRCRKLYDGGPGLALERILDVAIQIAWGLDYAHAQGLVHQDVKPANVMMTADGTAKVTDFGLARARRLAGERADVVPGGSILVSVGGMTPAYCSPEQAAGRSLSRQTDLWSWGLSVLEMFIGEVTWLAGQAAPEALAGYVETGGGGEGALPAMPAALVTLLAQCFAHDPKARPMSQGAVAARLRDIYRTTTGQAYARVELRPAELTADSLNNRALSLLDLGKASDAEATWQAALAADPQHPETIYNRGLLLWRRAETTDQLLLQQLESIEASHRSPARAHYLLALVHLERGDPDSARALLERAASLAPEDSEISAALGTTRSAAAAKPRDLGVQAAPISTVCLTRDGRYAVSGAADGAVGVWDLAAGRRAQGFQAHGTYVLNVHVTSDGRHAVTATEGEPPKLWDLASGRCLRTFEGSQKPLGATCLSPDGRYLVTGVGMRGSTVDTVDVLQLWDVATGRRLRSASRAHVYGISSISVLPDSSSCLATDSMGPVYAWQFETGALTTLFDRRYTWALADCLSPGGRHHLSANEDSMKLWDITTATELATFAGHTDRVRAIRLSVDGQWAVSVSRDRTVRLWETATGRCVRTFVGHGGEVHTVALDPDIRFAVSGGQDRTLIVWPLPVRDRYVAAPQMSRIWSHAQATQAKSEVEELLERASHAQTREDFDRALALVRQARQTPGHERTAQTLDAWATLARVCARTGFRGAWLAREMSIRPEDPWHWVVATVRWALARPEPLRALERALEMPRPSAYRRDSARSPARDRKSVSCCLSPDGHLLLLGYAEGSVALLEVATGRLAQALTGHKNSVEAVAFSPTGRQALTGSRDKDVRLWDLDRGECLRVLSGSTEEISHVHYTPDGLRAISGCGGPFPTDPTLRLWDLESGRCVHTFEEHCDSVASLSLTPDRRFLLTAARAFGPQTPHVLRLWDVASGRCLLEIQDPDASTASPACLTPDGRWAVAADQRHFQIWELDSRRCLQSLESGGSGLVALSRDARWAVLSDQENTLRLWELDWELQARPAADWDDAALPYLETFLRRTRPGAGGIERERDLTELLGVLQDCGLGWLRHAGVSRKLAELAASGDG
jgi:WD40 repeat protein/serine/threonine protein kinase